MHLAVKWEQTTCIKHFYLISPYNYKVSLIMKLVIRVLSMAGERSYFSKESVNCVVRGHHVYKHIWTPGIGGEISVEKQPGNLYDSFAVSVWISIEFASSCFLGLFRRALDCFQLDFSST